MFPLPNSRSSALAILYVMVTMNMTLKNAADYVRERRRFINPNPGFLRELGEEEVSVIMRFCLWPSPFSGLARLREWVIQSSRHILYLRLLRPSPSTAFAGRRPSAFPRMASPLPSRLFMSGCRVTEHGSRGQ